MLSDYRELRMVLESATNDALELLEESEDDFNTKVTQYMKDVREFSDILFHNEAVIRVFHNKLAMDDQRQSLIPSSADLNLNTSFHSATNQPKLKNIAVPSFDGNILNFQNFEGL